MSDQIDPRGSHAEEESNLEFNHETNRSPWAPYLSGHCR